MKRNWNPLPLAGFVLTLAAFLSYFFFFAYFPITRDFPWLTLLLFAAALGLLSAGLRRAFGQPERYRGRIAGPVFSALSVAVLGLFLFYTFSFSSQLPESKSAPQVGEKAAEFELPDAQGKLVKLADLLASPLPGKAEKPRWVLLIFYRGYW